MSWSEADSGDALTLTKQTMDVKRVGVLQPSNVDRKRRVRQRSRAWEDRSVHAKGMNKAAATVAVTKAESEDEDEDEELEAVRERERESYRGVQRTAAGEGKISEDGQRPHGGESKGG